MVFVQEWQQKLEDSLYLDEEQKEERHFQHKLF